MNYGIRSNVRYTQALRDQAKREKKFLVTVSVDGRAIDDQSCTVQGAADLKLERKIAAIALDLFKTKMRHK